MKRILITGKNCELSREAFSRAASHANSGFVLPFPDTREAVFYSGKTPDSAPGGTRLPSRDYTHPCWEAAPKSLCPEPLGAAFFWEQTAVWFVGSLGLIAILTVIWL